MDQENPTSSFGENMCLSRLSAIVPRLRDASRLATITGLALLLGAWRAEAGDVPFGPQRIIPQTFVTTPISVFATDMDGDGDQDILSASLDDNTISWFENTDGRGAFDLQHDSNLRFPGAL